MTIISLLKDVFCKSKAWALKLEAGNNKNHCRNEWDLYQKWPELRKVLPKCYGFAEFQYQGKLVHALMVERIACTLGAIITEISKQKWTPERQELLLNLDLLVVEAMAHQASHGGVRCRDWHIENIAFAEVADVGQSAVVCLIDWSGHELKPFLSPFQRMSPGMITFVKYLPGRYKYLTEEQIAAEREKASDDEHANKAVWDDANARTATIIESWWLGLSDVPSKVNIAELHSLLRDQGSEEYKVYIKQVGNSSLEGKLVLLHEDDGIATTSNKTHDTPSIQGSLPSWAGIRTPSSNFINVDPFSARADAELCPSLPVLAIRSLVHAARLHAERIYANPIYRKGIMQIGRIGRSGGKE